MSEPTTGPWHYVEEVDINTGQRWWAVYATGVGLVAPVVLTREDAQHIAALPDLEAALALGLRLSDDDGSDHNAFVRLENEFVEKGRAALAKARGQQ